MKKPKHNTDWDVLRILIGDYADWCRADEMKGGSDPADLEITSAQYQLSLAKVNAHIAKMEREYAK